MDEKSNEPEIDEDVIESLENSIVFEEDGSCSFDFEYPLAPYSGKGLDPFIGLTHVKIRRMRAGDLMAMDKAEGNYGKVFALISELTGLPISLMKRLNPCDFAKLNIFAGDELKKSQKTTDCALEFLRRRSAGRH